MRILLRTACGAERLADWPEPLPPAISIPLLLPPTEPWLDEPPRCAS